MTLSRGKRGRILCQGLHCQFMLAPWQCRNTAHHKQSQGSSHLFFRYNFFYGKSALYQHLTGLDTQIPALGSKNCDCRSHLYHRRLSPSAIEVNIPELLFTIAKCSQPQSWSISDWSKGKDKWVVQISWKTFPSLGRRPPGVCRGRGGQLKPTSTSQAEAYFHLLGDTFLWNTQELHPRVMTCYQTFI